MSSGCHQVCTWFWITDHRTSVLLRLHRQQQEGAGAPLPLVPELRQLDPGCASPPVSLPASRGPQPCTGEGMQAGPSKWVYVEKGVPGKGAGMMRESIMKTKRK